MFSLKQIQLFVFVVAVICAFLSFPSKIGLNILSTGFALIVLSGVAFAFGYSGSRRAFWGTFSVVLILLSFVDTSYSFHVPHTEMLWRPIFARMFPRDDVPDGRPYGVGGGLFSIPQENVSNVDPFAKDPFEDDPFGGTEMSDSNPSDMISELKELMEINDPDYSKYESFIDEADLCLWLVLSIVFGKAAEFVHMRNKPD